MKANQGRSAMRLLVVGGFAMVVAGCYKTPVTAEYPVDYRQRHPIVVREGVQNVEVMVGRNRGGLTPSQRADMVSFAQAWRQESGSISWRRSAIPVRGWSCLAAPTTSGFIAS
jgi:pilus assembly protein CpaD